MIQVKQNLKVIVFCLNSLPKAIKQVIVKNKEITLCIYPQYLIKVLAFLKFNNNLQFKSLIDICAIDYPEKNKRFEVVYNLLSVFYNLRIRVKVITDELNSLPSATFLFSSSNWLEREIWDLYGIIFEGHADLRRILTDYGFEGHPLRKDFPLTGFIELRYDENKKQIVYEAVELAQEFRYFDAISPWEVVKK